MSKNQRTHELEPLIDNVTKEEIDRNRPGSPYVELDLSGDAAAQKIGAYYSDLQSRHAYWMREKAPFQAPELLPASTQFELELLEALVRQNGKVNFWDISVELMGPDNTLASSFNEGCEKFTHGLGLEVQQESAA